MGAKAVRYFVTCVVAAALALCTVAYWWVGSPLDFAGETVDLSIEPGTSARGVASAVAQEVQIDPALLYWWFRLSGESRQIKAGSYELDRTTTPRSLLRKLVRGEESLRSLTLVEGWNFRQVRDALRSADGLTPTPRALPICRCYCAQATPWTRN
jgi:UPF0755 protein